uniref:Uncharacterized protein n=1 Tax=Anguilla anguilla TaxID=7936 RepID=A0A0E9VLK1_ANGAN
MITSEPSFTLDQRDGFTLTANTSNWATFTSQV